MGNLKARDQIHTMHVDRSSSALHCFKGFLSKNTCCLRCLRLKLYNTLFNQNPKTTPYSAVTHNENHAEPTNDLVSSYRRLRVLYTNAWQNTA